VGWLQNEAKNNGKRKLGKQDEVPTGLHGRRSVKAVVRDRATSRRGKEPIGVRRNGEKSELLTPVWKETGPAGGAGRG